MMKIDDGLERLRRKLVETGQDEAFHQPIRSETLR
jgi:hypothetical protein